MGARHLHSRATPPLHNRTCRTACDVRLRRLHLLTPGHQVFNSTTPPPYSKRLPYILTIFLEVDHVTDPDNHSPSPLLFYDPHCLPFCITSHTHGLDLALFLVPFFFFHPPRLNIRLICNTAHLFSPCMINYSSNTFSPIAYTYPPSFCRCIILFTLCILHTRKPRIIIWRRWLESCVSVSV